MNQVFLSDKGWVEVIWDKQIDKDGYVAVATEMLRLITTIEDQAKEPLMLIDFSQLEGITAEAASLASKATRDLGCKKIAGFAIKPELKGILDAIKKTSTKEDTIREFKTREEAEKWLLE